MLNNKTIANVIICRAAFRNKHSNPGFIESFENFNEY